MAFEPAAAEPEPLRNQRNYRITDTDRLGTGSLKQKCRGNLAAIELLKRLETEGREATAAEKRTLVRYVGWGGLPQVFDAGNEEWQDQRTRLEQLLTAEELDSARATTLNAHYTAPGVIRAMYAALQRLGFEHGRILEPALGLGHFIGLMPDEMHGRSLITGIEIDAITARLAKALYPDADIRHQPFEESKLADGFYDVAISNVPFGSHAPYDPRFKGWGFLIHDYFFAATLDKVRPGGLILFITSKGTLDKRDAGLREYVASQADLIGAIRLPDDAFKKNANTEVTTDLVILRKRLPGEPPSGPAWKDGLAEITNSQGETIAVNEYFASHPEMLLGEMRLEGRMYGRGEPTLVSNGRPLAERLAEAIALLPRDVFKVEQRKAVSPTLAQSFPAPEHIKPNAYALVNDQIALRDGDSLQVLTGLSGQVAKRIRGLIRVRDAVRRCLCSQLNGTLDEDVVAAREELNRTYDRFVARLGPISQRANTSAFRGDPDLPLLLSLEQYDEESGRATKAAIFRERTIQKQRPVPSVGTPQEALLVNPLVIEKARVDAEVARLGRLHCEHQETQYKLRSRVRHLTADLPRLEQRLDAVRRDLTTRQDTSGEQFVLVLEGQEIRDRGIAGELLLRRAERLRGSRSERPVGSLAGFQLFVADNFLGGPEFVLKGATTYTAKVTDTAHGTIRSVEYALQHLEDVAEALTKNIADTRKRLADTQVQLGVPFEYAERLAELVQRQRALEDALDLTRNQAQGNLPAEPERDEAPVESITAALPGD